MSLYFPFNDTLGIGEEESVLYIVSLSDDSFDFFSVLRGLETVYLGFKSMVVRPWARTTDRGTESLVSQDLWDR